jgi:hypothetical protein
MTNMVTSNNINLIMAVKKPVYKSRSYTINVIVPKSTIKKQRVITREGHTSNTGIDIKFRGYCVKDSLRLATQTRKTAKECSTLPCRERYYDDDSHIFTTSNDHL